jgi:hypothetical protein
MRVSSPATFSVPSSSLGALSGSFNTPEFAIFHLYGWSAQCQFLSGSADVANGQVTGSIKLQASNQVVKGYSMEQSVGPKPTVWTDISGSTAPIAVGPGTPTQTVFWNYGQMFGRYVRGVYTHTSGTGSLGSFDWFGKGASE